MEDLTSKMLREEAEEVHQRRFDEQIPDLYRALAERKSAALCLSGGGIRSAAFALGVVQALASHPRGADRRRVDEPENSLLAQFHYLSTVSGGGYTGSWLSVAIKRMTFPVVWKNLVSRSKGPDCEPRMISWL